MKEMGLDQVDLEKPLPTREWSRQTNQNHFHLLSNVSCNLHLGASSLLFTLTIPCLLNLKVALAHPFLPWNLVLVAIFFCAKLVLCYIINIGEELNRQFLGDFLSTLASIAR